MLKVNVISTQENKNYWEEVFSNVWEGPVEVSISTNSKISSEADLIILDFNGDQSSWQNTLNGISPNLVNKHFLISSDKKDADLAIEAIRLGAIGFLVKPFKRSELIVVLDRLHSAPKSQMLQTKKAKIIALASYKGGTGVSTTTVNLGYAISHIYQKKTLIIDAAGFANHITVLFNSMPKCTLVDICKQGKNFDEHYLTNAVSLVEKNLGIIGGFIKPSDFNEIKIEEIEYMIEVASEAYDYILIDTSTHLLDEINMFFIQKATDLLLLTTFDLLAIRDNRFYIQLLKEFGISENKIKPIINRHDWYVGSLEPDVVQKQINHPIFHAIPNDWQLCVESSNYGRPVLEFAPNSPLATSYTILASKFTKLDVPEQQLNTEKSMASQHTDQKSKKKSILHWF